MSFSITKSLTTIAVIDWQVSLSFYAALLQMPPQKLQTDRYAEFCLANLTIALYVPRATEPPSPSTRAHPSLSLCLYVQPLSAAIERLTALGYAPPKGIQQSSHGQEIYVYDPNGNRIILYEPN
ncbi:hypothetical protein IQ266_20320 [filamentous cyanobacterium LEGE 11480]|uniref:VOC domain-containing protein n=1 Tax=Romeriopsis navalis LEGE 11480 TaxID=2777977 RepID=A0A928Z606_9CYAN|nr:VOC family protein [Romeriopsis navalis]MBE9032088.1 hypothetical protein [Romeriopsis navalis LEGE 11480]